MVYQKTLKLFIVFSLVFVSAYGADIWDSSSCPNGKTAYKYLMHDSSMPFAMSVGTSMSQTHISENTVHPEFVRKKMLEIAKKLGKDEGLKWLKNEKRIWYLLHSMPEYNCKCGFKDISELNQNQIYLAIYYITYDFMNKDELKITDCPKCSEKLTKKEEKKDLFTEEMQNKMAALIHDLNFDEKSLAKIPNARLSIEISDVLKSGTTEIDEHKLNNLVSFINKIGNPMIVFHHYANPQALPNLFEKEEHAKWFADVCAKIIEKLPNITHVCPVSQPTGFMFRVTRNQDLPPFEYGVDQDTLLKNIMKASALAAEKMKAVRNKNNNAPSLKVLVSHQWKMMIPKHNYYDPRYALELLVTTIADKMYNGKFVNTVQPYLDKFDGIALSVYPAMKFDMWKPDGSNIAGAIDYAGSLGAVVETNKAFPLKDIYIVEAGCNNADEKVKKEYIDMMLCVCARARQAGIPVKALYFWAITNHPDFYMEWNTPKGTTHFAPFDTMEVSSINAGGRYMKDIISSLK
jgi:hypothetical protein